MDVYRQELFRSKTHGLEVNCVITHCVKEEASIYFTYHFLQRTLVSVTCVNMVMKSVYAARHSFNSIQSNTRFFFCVEKV